MFVGVVSGGGSVPATAPPPHALDELEGPQRDKPMVRPPDPLAILFGRFCRPHAPTFSPCAPQHLLVQQPHDGCSSGCRGAYDDALLHLDTRVYRRGAEVGVEGDRGGCRRPRRKTGDGGYRGFRMHVEGRVIE
jgi:hypothetical protein